MKHTVTKEHFDKYSKLCLDLKIDLSKQDKFLNRDRNQFLKAYQADKYLNTVPSKEWDQKATILQAFYKQHKLELFECICIYKHAVIFTFLNMEPEFIK